MLKKVSRNDERMRRHVRVRTKISGTPECPRLNVFRSNSNIHAQIIDDVNGVTLASASSVELKLENGGNVEAAKTVGTEIAKRAIEKNIWCRIRPWWICLHRACKGIGRSSKSCWLEILGGYANGT